MFAIAPTDLRLFDNLRASPTGALVNFWTPTPWNIKGLRTGDRLYMLLKSPIRKIAGYGVFRRYSNMSASRAWSAYGIGNGVRSLDELLRLVDHFAGMHSKNYTAQVDPEIGCIELADVVTFAEAEFIRPDAFSLSMPTKVVKIKYFPEPDPIRLKFESPSFSPFTLVEGISPRESASHKKRVRASAFRKEILSNYDQQCCITEFHLQELLEASHIQPYINEDSNHPQNGLCLRVDLHCLFDSGLITLDANFAVVLCGKLRGTAYDAFAGKVIALPRDPLLHPSAAALEFHRAKVFREPPALC
jgi:HNH endonuclease